MILSDYEAKRHDLEKQMQELNVREAEHKMELSIRYQAECKKIQQQIGQLKKKTERPIGEVPAGQAVCAWQVP